MKQDHLSKIGTSKDTRGVRQSMLRDGPRKTRSRSLEAQRKMAYCLRNDKFSECLAAIVLNEDSSLHHGDEMELPGAMKEVAPERSTNSPNMEER